MGLVVRRIFVTKGGNLRAVRVEAVIGDSILSRTVVECPLFGRRKWKRRTFVYGVIRGEILRRYGVEWLQMTLV
jgi:hypothetical protein